MEAMRWQEGDRGEGWRREWAWGGGEGEWQGLGPASISASLSSPLHSGACREI